MSLTNPVAREPSASIASSIAGSVVDGAVYPSHALPWGADNVFRNATAFTSDLETTSEAGLFSGYFRIDNGSRNTTKYIFCSCMTLLMIELNYT